jgi:acylphosphatase
MFCPISQNNMDGKTRAHIFVSGRVQGVFYRENTKKKAEKYGILGWVKNLKDGKVEAVFEGEKGKIEKILKWAKRGPFFAKVENLEIITEDYKGEFNCFEIKYDL